jgi:glutamate/tyrosine decarboxylase-like PLP-dependent enzyme
MPTKDGIYIVMGTSQTLTTFSPTSTSVLVDAFSMQNVGFEGYVKHIERGIMRLRRRIFTYLEVS